MEPDERHVDPSAQITLRKLPGHQDVAAVRWNLPMAGTLLAALPTLSVHVLFGRPSCAASWGRLGEGLGVAVSAAA